MRKKNWIILSFFIIISIYIFWYALYGKIAISAKGNALLLTPETVKNFQTEINGKIKKWYVKVGDVVQVGTHLVTIEQPLKQKELEQNKKKLQEVQTKNTSIFNFTKKYIDLERKSIQDRRKVLKDRIQYIEQQIAQRKETLEGIKAHKIPYLQQHKKQQMTRITITAISLIYISKQYSFGKTQSLPPYNIRCFIYEFLLVFFLIL